MMRRFHRRCGGAALSVRRPSAELLERRTLLAVQPLDPSFGEGGVVRMNLPGPGSDSAEAVVVTADGGIVAAGRSAGAPNYDNGVFAVARYTASGAPDAAFGQGGFVLTRVGAGDAGALAIALQRDGKVVAAGYADGAFALARYGTDGALDPTFGDDGIVTTPDLRGRAYGLALAPDGDFIAVGEVTAGASSAFALARYGADGSLDASFGGGDGIVVTDFGSPADGARDVALAGDKILVGGYASARSPSGAIQSDSFALARYHNDGTLDGTFGTGGKVTTYINEGYSVADDLEVAPDGRILLAGTYTGHNGAIVRYNPDGSVDTTFANQGRLVWGNRPVHTLRLQPGGRILAGGRSTIDFSDHLTVYAFTPSGAADLSFGGGDGKATIDIGDGAGARGLDFDAAGRIVAAGYAETGFELQNFAVARLRPDGEPDTTFDGDGRTTTDFPADSFSVGRAAAVAEDGDLLVAVSGGNRHFPLLKLNPDGTPDAAFGVSGLAAVANTDPFDFSAAVRDVLPVGGGKILVAGDYRTDFALARYNADGTPDLSFGANGIVVTNLPYQGPNTSSSDAINAVAVQPDGKIVVAGTDGDRWGLARYHPDGSLDTSFGTGGLMSVPTTGELRDVVVQPDGRIVVGGEYYLPDYGDAFTVARFNPDGTFDATFGDGGKVTLAATPTVGPFGMATAVALRPGGKILVGGNQRAGHFTFYGLNPDGSLDTSFGNAGLVLTAFSDGPAAYLAELTGLALRPDGSFVAAGMGRDERQFTVKRGVVAAYNADGSLERSFGTDGKLVAAAVPAIEDVVLQEGKPVVVGADGVDLAAARFLPGSVLEFTTNGLGSTERRYGTTVGSFRVERGGSLESPLTLTLTVGGTATPGVDYEALPAAVTIPAGQASVTVPVTAINDYVLEGHETVRLTLAPVAGYTFVSPDTAEITVLDDEGPDRYEPNDSAETPRVLGEVASRFEKALSLHEASDVDYFSFTTSLRTDVVARVSSPESLPGLTVELFKAGGDSLGRAETTSGVADVVATLLPGTYLVRVSSAAGAANPDYNLLVDTQRPYVTPFSVSRGVVTQIEAERFDRGGERLAYHDTTAANAGGAFRPDEAVDISAAPGGGFHVTDGRPGEWLEYTLNVVDRDTYDIDVLLAGPQGSQGSGTFHMELEGVDFSGPLPVPEAGDGFFYAGAAVLLEPGRHVLRLSLETPGSAGDAVADVDSLRITPRSQTVSVTAADATADENGGDTGRFVISRVGSRADALVVNYSVRGTAADATDYVALSGTTTIPAGAGSVEVVVTGVDDRFLDPDETVELVISADPKYSVGNPSSAVVRIRDDEQPDRFERNDSFGDARNLGFVDERREERGLSMHTVTDSDYFRFTTLPGAAAVSVAFEHDDGDLTVVVFNNNGQEVARSAGAGDSERVTFPGTGAQMYARVTRAGGSVVQMYDLLIEAPAAAPAEIHVRASRPPAPAFDVFDGQSRPVDFGTVQAGALGDAIFIYINNTGGRVLSLGALTVPAGFTVGGTLPQSALPGETVGFFIRVDSTSPGVKSGELTLVNGDTDEGLYNVPLSGVVLGEHALVAARHVFYGRSALDGDVAAGPGDDGAIAADKRALLPGDAAGPANVTNYSRGINGIMVDIAGVDTDAPDLSDFVFKVGNDANPAGWGDAPLPQVSVRRGAGVGGSVRVTFTWPDGAIRNTWLQVTMKANARTGLAAPDVFYFGNLVGEAVASAAPVVNVLDLARTRADVGRTTPAALAASDFNRDGRVNAVDVVIVRAGQRRALPRFTAPGGIAAAATAPASSRPNLLPRAGGDAAPARRGVWDEQQPDLLS